MMSKREVNEIDCMLSPRGILVRPLGGYGMRDAVRITIGKHRENEAFLGALEAKWRQAGDAGAGKPPENSGRRPAKSAPKQKRPNS